jgi:hypothetical protein
MSLCRRLSSSSPPRACARGDGDAGGSGVDILDMDGGAATVFMRGAPGNTGGACDKAACDSGGGDCRPAKSTSTTTGDALLLLLGGLSPLLLLLPLFVDAAAPPLLPLSLLPPQPPPPPPASRDAADGFLRDFGFDFDRDFDERPLPLGERGERGDDDDLSADFLGDFRLDLFLLLPPFDALPSPLRLRLALLRFRSPPRSPSPMTPSTASPFHRRWSRDFDRAPRRSLLKSASSAAAAAFRSPLRAFEIAFAALMRSFARFNFSFIFTFSVFFFADDAFFFDDFDEDDLTRFTPPPPPPPPSRFAFASSTCTLRASAYASS